MDTIRNRVGEVYEPFKVRFLEREIHALADDEVLVRVRASAICGSDLHIARGLHPSAPLPVTIGHEFSGDVTAVGSGVDNVRVGQRVTVEPCIVCGKCDACRHGDYGYCEHISFTYRNGDGAMADYVVVKAPYVYELPEYLTSETGALIEPLSVATHAVRRAQVALGETVLIIGAGAMGMMVAAMCRRSGAAQVIIADFSDSRLEMALQVGATIAINSGRADLEQEVARLTGGKGVDKSFECVGPRKLLFAGDHDTAAQRYGHGRGNLPQKPQVTFPASRLVTHEIRIQGAQGYCWDFPIAIAAARDLPLEKFVTHTFPLEQMQQALNTALDRGSKSIKVIVKPSAARAGEKEKKR
ncbi:MAG: alcohol dehydrogenase catalytic domain-containing protein [Ruthenibacterium lactatiformans]